MEGKYLKFDESLLSVEELRFQVSEAVLAAEAAYHIGREDNSDQLRENLLRRLKEHLGDYILIRVRGELAGFFCFYKEGNSMVIYDLYILPYFRCRGLATKALDICISQT